MAMVSAPEADAEEAEEAAPSVSTSRQPLSQMGFSGFPRLLDLVDRYLKCIDRIYAFKESNNVEYAVYFFLAKAISVLHQVVLRAPVTPDAYHTLGLAHDALGDKKRAFGFYLLAAYLIVEERGDIDQANYCHSKEITADPKDIQLRLHCASLYLELKDYKRAAESYDQIHQLSPEIIEAWKTSAKNYRKNGASRFQTRLRDVAPFSKWDKKLSKIVFDPRFKAIPSYSTRRSLFEHFAKTRVEEERKEKRDAQKAAIEGFKQLLDEALEIDLLEN
ncbi:hypothetical protein F8388_001057 [Cannabis sativa]|uniref:FF domain-containing protein n=1 Tax=Cannabis sativa TaxID=3483 RepID=A0A7J6EDE4_CANSA|nr:hypothetical protein F8388_001057 [Cannabis sativa]